MDLTVRERRYNNMNLVDTLRGGYSEEEFSFATLAMKVSGLGVKDQYHVYTKEVVDKYGLNVHVYQPLADYFYFGDMLVNGKQDDLAVIDALNHASNVGVIFDELADYIENGVTIIWNYDNSDVSG